MSTKNLAVVHPNDICVSDENERKEVVIDTQFEESISNHGVLEPPLVRTADNGGYRYEVIAGQRRTLAAQNVGLDEIHVVVLDCSDSDALCASLIENMEEFKQSVSLNDRAEAVHRLRSMNEWTIKETAEQLDVTQQTISTWLECMRSEWEGTAIHPDNTGPIDIDSIPQRVFGIVRKQVGGGRDGEQAISVIERESLRQKDVIEASKLADMDNPHSFLDHLENMGKKRRQQRQTSVSERANVDVTWTGETAENLRDAAADVGCTVEQFVEQTIANAVDNDGSSQTQSTDVNIDITNY